MSVAQTKINRKSAAGLLRIPEASVNSLFKGQREVPLGELVQAWIEQSTTIPDADAEIKKQLADRREELLGVKASTKELKARLIDGRAFRTSEIQAVVSSRLGAVASKLRAIGPKLALQLVGQPEREIRAMVEREVEDALAEFVLYDPKDFACPKLFFETEVEGGESGDGQD